jgi:hypothetical protein
MRNTRVCARNIGTWILHAYPNCVYSNSYILGTCIYVILSVMSEQHPYWKGIQTDYGTMAYDLAMNL